MTDAILSCRNLSKRYNEGRNSISVLDSIDFEVFAGSKVAIVGASGSGKSTLLNLLGGLDKPSGGEVRISGKDFSTLSDNARGNLRNKYLGFVYQFHHLLPEFNASENVAMPLLISGERMRNAEKQVRPLLERVGVAHRASHKPAELSGGERQRVAIARALAMQPKCVLLDEPTGNLDTKNAQNIHALIDELSLNSNTSFVVVTHDEKLAASMDQVFVLNDGTLTQRSDK